MRGWLILADADEVRAFVVEWLSEWYASDGLTISSESSLVYDVGLDSLSLVEFVVAVEAKFGVELPEDIYLSARNFGTVSTAVQSIIKVLDKRGF